MTKKHPSECAMREEGSKVWKIVLAAKPTHLSDPGTFRELTEEASGAFLLFSQSDNFIMQDIHVVHTKQFERMYSGRISPRPALALVNNSLCFFLGISEKVVYWFGSPLFFFIKG